MFYVRLLSSVAQIWCGFRDLLKTLFSKKSQPKTPVVPTSDQLTQQDRKIHDEITPQQETRVSPKDDADVRNDVIRRLRS